MSLIDVVPSHVGRPKRISRGERRREEIVRVAQQVFLELGFNEATMQIIASRAGASKETLYRHFGCKESFFTEIIRSRTALVFSETADEFPPEGEPKKVLLRIGYNLLKLLVGDESLRLFRVVATETPRTPELGRIFFDQGPAQIIQELMNYLSNAREQGHLSCADPTLAAKLFLGSIVGARLIVSLIVPGYDVITEEEIQLHVEEAVAMFLARYSGAAQRPISPIIDSQSLKSAERGRSRRHGRLLRRQESEGP